MKVCMKDLAKAVLLAQQFREESWDSEKRKYNLSQYEAADRAAKEIGFDDRAYQLISLLNLCVWNDIQAWAKEVVKS